MAAAANYAFNTLTIILGTTGPFAAPGNLPISNGTITIRGDVNNQDAYVLTGAGQPSKGVVQTNSAVVLQGLRVENTGTQSHTIAAAAGSCVLDHVSAASPSRRPARAAR